MRAIFKEYRRTGKREVRGNTEERGSEEARLGENDNGRQGDASEITTSQEKEADL